MVNHGIGDIEILKVRKIDLGRVGKWDYFASSLNRYFDENVCFGNKTYKNLSDMAEDVNKIINSDETINIVDGKYATRIKPKQGFQYSKLDDDEMLELIKKVLFLRVNKLEEVVR